MQFRRNTLWPQTVTGDLWTSLLDLCPAEVTLRHHQHLGFQSEDLDHDSDVAPYTGVDVTYPGFGNRDSLLLLNAPGPPWVVGLPAGSRARPALEVTGALSLQRSPRRPAPEHRRLRFPQRTAWWRLLTSPAPSFRFCPLRLFLFILKFKAIPQLLSNFPLFIRKEIQGRNVTVPNFTSSHVKKWIFF